MRTGFPVSDEEILALKVKVLRDLAAAQYPREALGAIALKYDLSFDDARALVQQHGWPEARSMGKAADVLEGKIPAEPERPKVPLNGASGARTTESASALAAPPKPTPNANGTELMIAAAEKSTKARTRRLAIKVRKDLAELQGLVVAERKEAEAAQVKAEETARLKAEVAELELELAQKKALLRPTAAKRSEPAKPRDDSAKKIRAWAADNDIACAASGRVPQQVVEAYQAANPSEGDA